MKPVYRGYFKLQAHSDSECLMWGIACTREGKKLANFEVTMSALHSDVLANARDQEIVKYGHIFDMTYSDVEKDGKDYRVSLRGVVDWNVK